MASKKSRALSSVDLPDEPDWPTTMRSRLADGRLLGADQSVWLYMKVPMSPVEDAKTLMRQLQASAPLLHMFNELSDMTMLRGLNRRRLVRANYREFHLLALNLRSRFVPPYGHRLAGDMAADFAGETTKKRLLLFGVKLRPSVAKGSLRDFMDSVAHTFTEGGVLMSEFEKDTDDVRAAMNRSGLVPATTEEIRLANAWWNFGQYPDTPIMPEPNWLNIFRSADATRMGRRLADQGKSSLEWPDLKGHHVVSFGAVQDLDLDWVQVDKRRAQWAGQLIDSGAIAISVRGKVEPGKVTGKEVEAQRRSYIADINERVAAGKLDKPEQAEKLQVLEEVQRIYADQDPPPTLVDTSIVVAFDGIVENMIDLSGPGYQLNSMTLRQSKALAEMWLCSHLRANPHLLDLPSSAVGYSGLVSLSTVGDEPEGSALLGFTERDRQPAWFNHSAAMDGDSAPLTLVAGQSGSGKSVLMQWMANQFGRLGNPAVIVDPKQGQDLSPSVLASGGTVVSLDDLLSADGILDPLRFSLDAESGMELAASVLSSVNVWGTNLADYETPLQVALKYGVDNGATCTGMALKIARDAGRAPKEMVDKVLELAEANSLFRAMVGMDNDATTALRVSEGVTLIKVGNVHLPLPEPGAVNPPLTQRVALALVRMLVLGSSTAVSYRDGVVFLDEAWVFLSAGHAEIERLGRLARSMRVAVWLLTQRVSDALKADITDFISTGIILPMQKQSEAEAACHLLELEPTRDRLRRIMADATVGVAGGSTAPNWDSMRALYEPGTRNVLRGTVGIYSDIHDRAVPVEIKIPERFLKLASTNKADIEAREAARREAEQQQRQLDGGVSGWAGAEAA